ncbi:AAA family ATPase [Candidatus Bathyarchaeota archaeon]|nr:AAA family ATPase [Candidatus Bathyarchaeota archaeon]
MDEAVKEIKKKSGIIGREIELKKILLAASIGKHVLLEGVVGVGKTKLAKAVADFLNRPVYRVDGDERYTENKLIGWFDPPILVSKGYVKEAFIPGPLFLAMVNGGVLFINELNRMPESTQNVLLPAMDEKTIIVPKIGEIKAKNGFIIIATQNPEEYVGTTRLSEALKDRFVWVKLDYQSKEEEKEIVKQETKCFNDKLAALAVEIINTIRKDPNVKRGPSIRGAIDIVDLLKNKENLTIEEVLEAGVMALNCKIELALKSEETKEELIKKVMLSILAKTNFLKDFNSKNFFRNSSITIGNDVEYVNFLIYVNNGEKIEKIITHELNLTNQNNIESIKIKKPNEIFNIYIEKFDNLKDEEKRIVKNYVAHLIIKIASEISEKGKRKTKKVKAPYALGDDEIDEDLTLENILGKKAWSSEDLITIKKEPKKIAVALMLDISNSMQRAKMLTAALAVGALAYKLEKDYYSIITFKNEAAALKLINEEVKLNEVVERILSLEVGGLTNIKAGLDEGAFQLNSLNDLTLEKIGILVTDGWLTAGDDPKLSVKEFNRLYVIQTGVGGGSENSVKLCKDLAKLGQGKYVFIEDLNELPSKLIDLFR